jgi:hypothetical protein
LKGWQNIGKLAHAFVGLGVIVARPELEDKEDCEAGGGIVGVVAIALH